MKKKIMVLILVISILLTSGCGNYVTDKKNKSITFEKTGQVIQNNILCKPTDKELSKLYEKYDDQLKVSIKKLPECQKFKLNSNKSNSLWEGIFVKPLAYIILKLGYLVKNFGLSVMLIGLAIRLILMPFARKTQKQSDNMKKAAPEIQRIERKYADKTDTDSMMAKSQETMLVYKKYNINPMSSCLMSFIQLPLFFAFLEAINRVPAIFEDSFLGLNLGMTPLVGLKQGKYLYIILIILIFLTTYFSFKKSMSQTGNADQDKQMKHMLTFMLVFIVIASFNLSTAIALYWVVTNGFVVLQNYIFKKLADRPDNRENKGKAKSKKKMTIKDKLNMKKGV